MWPWQRSGEQPNCILLRRILAVISLGHGSVLLWMFVFYGDHTSLYSREMIEVLLDADVTVVMVPLSKVVNKTVPVVAPVSKVAQKKESKPETALAVKQEPKKEQKKPEPKKAESAPVKKEEPKKQVAEKKDVVKKEPNKQVSVTEKDVETQNVIHVGQHEYAALEVQKLIQQEAQRCWKSPIGVGSDVSCQVVVCVDHNGSVKDITLAQQSGVVMYDVHARQAVSRMQFPRGAWGKEVVVYFKQS